MTSIDNGIRTATSGVTRGITALLQPRTIAVIGASMGRHTLGNQVLRNLRQFGFGGTVIPVHPRAESIEGLPTVSAVADLPDDVDAAVVSVRASAVTGVLRELAAYGCPSAVVPAAGFTADEMAELTDALQTVPIVVNGPNCLGTLSAADAAPLWTARVRADFRSGNVALITQSGSAAISVTTTTDLGFSRVISSGNELSLSAADYLTWLATDEATTTVGLVLESLTEPDRFAAAVRRVQQAGKRLVCLKVGRTSAGGRATQAHTGALVTGYDAYQAYFRRLGVPLVQEYDELVATLQLYAALRDRPVHGNRLAVMSISGGQSALACDVATEIGAAVAEFAPPTGERIRDALPGTTGENPVDIGASIDELGRRTEDAVAAVGDDPGVDSVLVVQDAQEKLPLTPEHDYVDHLRQVVRGAAKSGAPVAIASSTSAAIHPMLRELADKANVPVLQGLRPAAVALNSLGVAPPDAATNASGSVSGDVLSELRADIAQHHGVLPHPLVQRILAAYDLPYARSILAKTEDEAVEFAREVGFPVVVKIASTDVPHRVDVGGVVTGVESESALRVAIRTIADSMEALPEAVIDGYEVQEAVTGSVESILGFKVEAPFGAMVIVGSGGSLAELVSDRAVDLAPVAQASARAMVDGSHLGKLLSGYRKLAAVTSVAPLVDVIVRFGALAADLGDLVTEADLNPVFIREGDGQITLVDALFVAG